MFDYNKLLQYEPTPIAKEFADNISLYAFANPENPNGDSIASHVVKRLLQYAYDQGNLNRHVCVDNKKEWCGCE